jgi:hypothetical protein
MCPVRCVTYVSGRSISNHSSSDASGLTSLRAIRSLKPGHLTTGRWGSPPDLAVRRLQQGDLP